MVAETGNALDCPIESCPGGEITWGAVEGRNLVVFNAGSCYVCGTLAAECPICGEVTGDLAAGDVKCDSCVGRYALNIAPGDLASVFDLTWWMPESTS